MKKQDINLKRNKKDLKLWKQAWNKQAKKILFKRIIFKQISDVCGLTKI